MIKTLKKIIKAVIKVLKDTVTGENIYGALAFTRGAQTAFFGDEEYTTPEEFNFYQDLIKDYEAQRKKDSSSSN